MSMGVAIAPTRKIPSIRGQTTILLKALKTNLVRPLMLRILAVRH